ncbi:CDF family Co(II)/Ni(II) efflux transporter DmeF [Massilia cavernae]|uniref:Cation transporter n=1 Tax=Massilia cavernae TaxID=2320864 RepID=A0A418XQK5_9BURK|nr:CDF family Co(II)/Ni(II) efflux transporter DmeF [Massilia cavernae]RJG14727.1 cation transporter [Massilia cavernae]
MIRSNNDIHASAFVHDHVFDGGKHAAERGTRLVMWITALMMLVEITAGWWFNSMALLADGWHMSSHALAIGLSAFAYSAARKYARDPRFAFGTWKIEILAGYTSAVSLLGIAGLMAFSSFERLLSPQPIHYRDAIVIAVIGLVVNVACAVILGGAHHHHGHGHDHGEHHGHDHHGAGDGHRHHDLNLKAAYLHVIADAATSVLAIAALAGGWLFGWAWLDPVMGIAGAVLVALWARNLIADTGKVLLDREMDAPVVEEIRQVVEEDKRNKIVDLHVWRVGQHAYSCALTVLTRDQDLTPDHIRDRLAIHEEIVHSTIEVNYLA